MTDTEMNPAEQERKGVSASDWDDLYANMHRLRRHDRAYKGMPGMVPSEMHVLVTIGQLSDSSSCRATHGEDGAAEAPLASGPAADEKSVEATPSAVAERMGITRPALSQALKALEKKGLVTRARSERDNRVVVLTLTDQGWDCLDQARERRHAYLQSLTDYLGPDDSVHLFRIVGRLFEFYGSCDSDAPACSCDRVPDCEADAACECK